ncbi:imidazolonepropionase [bacterium (candidate division B38) B3_B38]|nr:MAG: imidazolonepropionase [bacterium (candidate division B38) B3_B38]
MIKADLVIENARQVITCRGKAPKLRGEMMDLGLITQGWVASYRGKISYVGEEKGFKEKVTLEKGCKVIDASEAVVLPGLVDSHTHLVFGGSREVEFVQRLRGVSYQEIARSGGGILSTVRATRAASYQVLLRDARRRLDYMLRLGTTTCEAKSGYGQTVDDELKLLHISRELHQSHPIDVVNTFLGAHTFPPEYLSRKEEYVDLLISEFLPRVREDGLAEFCDVFCEEGAFSLEQSRAILESGARLGFKLKLHADQLTSSGGAELAAELGAISADHLDYISDRGIEMLAEKGVAAVLLPGSNFFLRLNRYPPARRMIEAGVPVALATDFNPGTAMNESMPLTITLACLEMGLFPEEAINAATINSAYAVELHKSLGSIEMGKKADFIICSIPNYLHLIYHWGINHVHTVVKDGKIVVKEGRIINQGRFP